MVSKNNQGRLAALAGAILALAIAPTFAAVPGAPAAGKKAAKPKPAVAPASFQITDSLVREIAATTKMTSDSVRQTLAFIKKYKPIFAKNMVARLKSDPNRFRSRFRDISYSARRLAELKKSDPRRYARAEKMYALEAESDRLVEHYKEVSEAEKPQVEVQLTKVLGQLFDLRLEEERERLQNLMKEVEAMKKRIELRSANKDRIVDREVTSKLGLDSVLSW